MLLVVAGVWALAQNKIVPGGGEVEGRVYTWRYKMTVSVETPEGIKAGSAVREVSIKMIPTPQDSQHPYDAVKKNVRGEAVAVDLGERGVLFALIAYDSYREVFDAFPGPSGLTIKGVGYYASLKPGLKAPLSKEMPRLVYFEDLNNPLSVQQADAKDLAASFGDGVRLQSIQIEIADEPVTIGIEKFLPWLSKFYGKMLDGQRFNTAKSLYPVANSLSAKSFSTEINNNVP